MRAWKFAYQANCWGPLGGDGVGVTSINRLTYRTFADIPRAIEEIAEVGYQGVELFDGNLLDFEGRIGVLRALLERTGLTLVSVYSGANFIFPDVLSEELARIEHVCKVAAEAGALSVVVGGGAKRAHGVRAGDYDRLAEALDRVNDIARACGLTAHYHPHLTTLAETPEEVRSVFSKTKIRFCPDTAHLAAGGADLPEMLREHRERISFVHLKGWQREPFRFTPLDEGDLDMTAILRALDEIKFEGWIATELDEWPDPKDGAKRSLDFLKRYTQR
jgi:inosose dehydratase